MERFHMMLHVSHKYDIHSHLCLSLRRPFLLLPIVCAPSVIGRNPPYRTVIAPAESVNRSIRVVQ